MKYIEACENESWTLKLIHKKTLESWLVSFKCHSWRHEGDCRKWKNAQDFVRIRDAIKANREYWVYIVLTFDRKDWSNIFDSYRGLLTCWDKLRKRFDWRFGKIKYISLTEQHKDGYPHLNLLVYNKELFELCQGDGWKEIRKNWLEPNAVACGFGLRTWIEPIRSEEAIAGYFVKLCGEIAKQNQVPVVAPKNFRRLRASQGLLPVTYHNPEITGELLKKPLAELEKFLIKEANYVEVGK